MKRSSARLALQEINSNAQPADCYFKKKYQNLELENQELRKKIKDMGSLSTFNCTPSSKRSSPPNSEVSSITVDWHIGPSDKEINVMNKDDLKQALKSMIRAVREKENTGRN